MYTKLKPAALLYLSISALIAGPAFGNSPMIKETAKSPLAVNKQLSLSLIENI